MISKRDLKIFYDISKKYKVKKVFLFGSALKSKKANNINLAIKGIDDRLFFKYCGELYFTLSKPVDFVDLKINNFLFSLHPIPFILILIYLSWHKEVLHQTFQKQIILEETNPKFRVPY